MLTSGKEISNGWHCLPSRFNELNGRHEETRTPDLYRVKVRLTHTYNNFYVLGTTAKPLQIRVRRAKCGLESRAGEFPAAHSCEEQKRSNDRRCGSVGETSDAVDSLLVLEIERGGAQISVRGFARGTTRSA